MCRKEVVLFVLVWGLGAASRSEKSASAVVGEIYQKCLSELSTNCMKQKAEEWITSVVDQDVIKITENLAIIRTGNASTHRESERKNDNPGVKLIERIDDFLSTHSLQVKPSVFFTSKEARRLIPSWLLKGSLKNEVRMALVPTDMSEGRGFVRKVMLPFLLGLKFKTTVLVPLALAIIALKTWKAMTFGLLSLLLSGAIVIFKLLKPNVINYEVVHYPEHAINHHFDHYVDHHQDHHVDHHLEQYVDHHGYHAYHPQSHIDHHLDHVDEHLEPEPLDTVPDVPVEAWQPQDWSRQSNAQSMSYGGQI